MELSEESYRIQVLVTADLVNLAYRSCSLTLLYLCFHFFPSLSPKTPKDLNSHLHSTNFLSMSYATLQIWKHILYSNSCHQFSCRYSTASCFMTPQEYQVIYFTCVQRRRSMVGAQHVEAQQPRHLKPEWNENLEPHLFSGLLIFLTEFSSYHTVIIVW